MPKFNVSRATQITVLATAILAGIVIGRYGWSVSPSLIFMLLGTAIILFLINQILQRIKPLNNMPKRWLQFSFFGFLALATLCFGIWRGNETIFEKSSLSQLVDQKVAVTGVISDDPSRNDRGQLVFTLGSVRNEGQSIPGSIRVYTNYKKLQRGYSVRAEGKVVKNIGSVRARFTFAQVEVLSDKTGGIDQFRQKIFASSRTAIPDSLAGFGLGLLIGVKGLIPENLQDTLTLVGLTHLIAVSGYNLTIIVLFVHKVFGRISTYTATVASVWLIIGFLLITGFSASIVRAAFVAGLALLAHYYGYRIKAMTLIALPAAVTAVVNPNYIMHDLGWQLSFLAFFGILVLAPLAEQRFFARPNLISSLLTQSLSAHIMTFPLILLIFHSLSVVSPLANLLILPLVPLAMFLSFATGIVGLISPLLASWVALPTTGLLALMIGISQWIAGWGGASAQLSITPEMMIAFYASIILLIIGGRRGSRGRKTVDAPSVLKDRVLA